MSKQRERERTRVKKRQRRSRQLVTVGIALILIAALAFLFFSNQGTVASSAHAISRLSTDDYHSLAFSPTEPETVFFGHHEGLLVSHNGGKDWQPTSLTNADAMALAVPPSSPQTIYAAGHNVFVKSNDGGETWQSVPADLPGLDIHAFTADPENADRVFAFVVGFGIFGSEDGGVSWDALSQSIPSSTHGLAFGEDDQTLYAAATSAGLWRSQDAGQVWEPISGTPDEGAITVVYVRDTKRLYVTTLGEEAGLYMSEDQGTTWTSMGLRGIFLAIAVSPLDPNHLIVIDDEGQVFASRDGGDSWSDERARK